MKVVFTVLFTLSNVLLPDGAWLGFFLSWLLVLGLNVYSRLGLGYTFKRSFVALPFALVAVTALFSVPGEGATTIHFFTWRWVITVPGLIRFTSILVRSWLSIQAAILLIATTQFPDLLHGLRHLYVPNALVAIIAFMYRYLFVLTDETMRLLRARQARSARRELTQGKPPLSWQARVTGNMAGQLFLRSYERSDRVYNAMLARGYAGSLMTLNPHKLRARDWLLVITGISWLVLVQISGFLVRF